MWQTDRQTDGQTDRQTDGFAIAYSALSMLSRAKNEYAWQLSVETAIFIYYNSVHYSFYIIMPSCRTFWTPDCYPDGEMLKEAGKERLEGQTEDFYFSGINSLPENCSKCTELSRDQWWANPRSNHQPQILNLWTSNPTFEKANPKSQIANTQINSNLQTLNPKSFPNLQKLTYYRRKLDGWLCSWCQKVVIFDAIYSV